MTKHYDLDLNTALGFQIAKSNKSIFAIKWQKKTYQIIWQEKVEYQKATNMVNNSVRKKPILDFLFFLHFFAPSSLLPLFLPFFFFFGKKPILKTQVIDWHGQLYR